MGFCPIFGIWQDAGYRRLAKCDAGSFVGTSSISFASAQSAKAHPFRCASSQNRNRVAGLRFCIFCARRRNVGLCGTPAHTLAVWAKNRTQRRHAPHGGERCPLWKGARMQTVQGVTPLPSCSGKRQSHWSVRRSERMPRFRFAIFSVRSEMPSCFASARTSSAGLGCVRNLRSLSSICMVFVCTSLCRSGCCQRSRRRSPSTESHAPDEVQMQWLRPPVQCCSCPARQCGAHRCFSAARRSKRFWLKRGSR